MNKEKFWLKNFKNLFSSKIIPNKGMDLSDKLNAITRLIIIIFLVLFLLDFKYHLVFLILSLLFIIIIYYIKRKKMVEKFEKDCSFQWGLHAYGCNHDDCVEYDMLTAPLQVDPKTAFIGAGEDKEIHFGPEFDSLNQKLVGPVNPKTLISPIITPPIANNEYWKPNDFVFPSGINDSTNQNLHESGYIVSTCCGPKEDLVNPKINEVCPCNKKDDDKGKSKENFNGQVIEPFYERKFPVETRISGIPQRDVLQWDIDYNPPEIQESEFPKVYGKDPNCISYCTGEVNCDCKDCKRDFEYEVTPTFPGEIMTMNGYNPKQLLEHNIPSNYPVGECQLDKNLDSYNEMLFTQNLQPDVYTRNEIIEPINSNMGISFDQQFEPVTLKKDCNGMTFVSHDPKLRPTKVEPILQDPNLITQGDTYDPRFTSYGTSYRSYIDKTTGQPRFYYDDVEIHNKYNYITKNNIDFTNFGPSSGPLKANMPEYNSSIRELANKQFLDSSLEFRTGLQERLMRKINMNRWQQRVAPIRSNFGNKMGYN